MLGKGNKPQTPPAENPNYAGPPGIGPAAAHNPPPQTMQSPFGRPPSPQEQLQLEAMRLALEGFGQMQGYNIDTKESREAYKKAKENIEKGKVEEAANKIYIGSGNG